MKSGKENPKLSDSELKIMEQLWKQGDCTAKQLAEEMALRYGWNVNSTYTLIKRCIKKGAIARSEPGFVCHALADWESVSVAETEKLLDKVFDGSANLLFTALLGSGRGSKAQLAPMKRQLEELEEEL